MFLIKDSGLYDVNGGPKATCKNADARFLKTSGYCACNCSRFVPAEGRGHLGICDNCINAVSASTENIGYGDVYCTKQSIHATAH